MSLVYGVCFGNIQARPVGYVVVKSVITPGVRKRCRPYGGLVRIVPVGFIKIDTQTSHDLILILSLPLFLIVRGCFLLTRNIRKAVYRLDRLQCVRILDEMAPDSDDEQYYEFGDAFDDPEGFYAPPKPPTFAEHRMRSGEILTLRLVGSHPLYVRTTSDPTSET